MINHQNNEEVIIEKYFDIMTSEYQELALKFKCDEEQDKGGRSFLADSLRENSYIDRLKGLGTTHVFIERVKSKDGILISENIIGFFQLRMNAFICDDEKVTIGEPSLEISAFAVDVKYKSNGYGRIMMQRILYMAHELNNNYIGIKYVVLCAVKDSIDFYIKQKFKELKTDFENIPRDGRNNECTPMILKLNHDI
jgi:ribosomal protein S18 acetylase RimI-like enzyme